jgi:hypothetical protein
MELDHPIGMLFYEFEKLTLQPTWSLQNIWVFVAAESFFSLVYAYLGFVLNQGIYWQLVIKTGSSFGLKDCHL